MALQYIYPESETATAAATNVLCLTPHETRLRRSLFAFISLFNHPWNYSTTSRDISRAEYVVM